MKRYLLLILLPLYLPTWCSQADQTKTIAAVSVAGTFLTILGTSTASKLPFTSIFAKIKEKLKANWPQKIKYGLKEDTLIEDTNCERSARHLIELASGIKIPETLCSNFVYGTLGKNNNVRTGTINCDNNSSELFLDLCATPKNKFENRMFYNHNAFCTLRSR